MWSALLPLAGVALGGAISYGASKFAYNRQRTDHRHDALIDAACDFLRAHEELQAAETPWEIYDRRTVLPRDEISDEEFVTITNRHGAATRAFRTARTRVALLGDERVRETLNHVDKDGSGLDEFSEPPATPHDLARQPG